MELRKLKIGGIGCITSFSLNFDSTLNLICGANGAGKTTLLECATHVFTSGGAGALKSNVRMKSSTLEATIWDGEKEVTSKTDFANMDPNVKSNMSGLYLLAEKLIYLKTSRDLKYTALKAIPIDSAKNTGTNNEEAASGVQPDDIKAWLVRRYFLSGHQGNLNKQQLNNFELGKLVFSLLNPLVSFSKVDASNNDVLVNTPDGEMPFEYLSSGYKSIMIMLLSIIKEIEFRFNDPWIEAGEFDGIVAIDEIELHLHPDWQRMIIPALRKAFPKVQLIITTHSPHVIQNTEAHQIIALHNTDGNIHRLDIPTTKFGFQGWGIEDILTDVMGMKSTQSPLLDQTLEEFGKAYDNEDSESAKKAYETLVELLHPNDELKKLLKLQLESMEDTA